MENTFSAKVSDDSQQVLRVVVLVRALSQHTWTKLELSYDPISQLATGQSPALAGAAEFIVQAVDEAGNVSLQLTPQGKPYAAPDFNWLYLPVILRPAPLFTISGMVRSNTGSPLSGALVQLASGVSVTTDANGNYMWNNLQAGTYQLSVSYSNYTVAPASLSVTVPPANKIQDFILTQADRDIILNGGFEGDSNWQVVATSAMAAYASGIRHTGNQSMMAGLDGSTNKLSWSAFEQAISLP